MVGRRVTLQVGFAAWVVQVAALVDPAREAEHAEHLADGAGVLAEHRQLIDDTEHDGRGARVDRVVGKQEG
ncbi:hypothetical protein NKI59_22635 [Mesorhizobium sp. M0598]|uniref:hypothetical protein n=1 Tax=Mesorhizobium sp. M0598 TaxID=2956968 RepID=UPI00333A8DA6